MNATRKNKKTIGFAPGPEIASGTNKTVRRTRTGNHFSFVVSDTDSLNNKELVIVEFKRNQPKDIYEELSLYKVFGNLKISPKIMGVNIPGTGQISLREFLRNYNVSNVPNGLSYLVEKFNCSEEIFRYFRDAHGNFDYMHFFRKLNTFLTDKIVANSIINTDIKIPNLCVDHNGDIKMIDLDPNFIKPIQAHIDTKYYVNYMIFQVYINLVFAYNRNIRLNEIIDSASLLKMMQKMYRFADKGFHPIFMMMWYLEDQRFKSENDIRMNFNETQLIAHMKQAIQNKLPRQTPAMQKQVQTQVQSLVHTQVQVASPPLDPNNEIPWSFILPVFGIVVVAGTKYALGLGKNTRRKKRHSK
jgi:hypothetical protein